MLSMISMETSEWPLAIPSNMRVPLTYARLPPPKCEHTMDPLLTFFIGVAVGMLLLNIRHITFNGPTSRQ